MTERNTSKGQSVYRRVKIPEADTSVQQWFEMQDNVSLSVRLLIRSEIERSGMVDFVNRPVEKLPRRGRPPRDEYEHDDVPEALHTSPAKIGSVVLPDDEDGPDNSLAESVADDGSAYDMDDIFQSTRG